LNEELGFEAAADVAHEAIRSGRSVADVVAERRRRGAAPAGGPS
jgi:aspartate ammonia-lyase